LHRPLQTAKYETKGQDGQLPGGRIPPFFHVVRIRAAQAAQWSKRQRMQPITLLRCLRGSDNGCH